jgi:peptide chain release factor 3
MHKACWIESSDKEQLEDFGKRKFSSIAIDKHGREVFMADSPYSLHMAQEKFDKIKFHFTSEF